MNQNPESPENTPTPAPAPVSAPPAEQATASLKPAAPAGLRPPTPGLRPAGAAAAPGTAAPFAPKTTGAPTRAPFPSSGLTMAPFGRPASTEATAKVPERAAFVAPAPTPANDAAIPVFVPILSGLASAIALTFAVLLYLKQ